MSRTLLRSATVLVAGLALLVPLSGAATAHPATATFPDRIELPNGFQPEGITIGARSTAYLGSRVDGDIYAADLRTGRGRVVSQGPGTPSIGLKIDRRGLLYVAGGPAGTGRVVDPRSGQILASYPFTTGTTFVNDVMLGRRMAWFTDSRQPTLYGVPLARRGRPAPESEIVRLPLTGDWVQQPGVNNANGIAWSPDRRSLLVVQSNTGLLYRVDPQTGIARQVDLGGALLTNGDGLLVRGRTLYAVQNQLNQVAVVRLSPSGRRGTLLTTLRKPGELDVPSTVAARGRSLYLPNARFSTAPTPDTPYWITRLDRP